MYEESQITNKIIDPEDSSILTKEVRKLSQVVVRGPSLLTISPLDGSEIIDNPFAPPQ